MTISAQKQYMPGFDNNYLVAGNLCNAFVLGELGSREDFYLMGTEPEDQSNYPVLNGTILDSQGNLLFRLAQNIIVENPGDCHRIFTDRLEYEIRDANANTVLHVKTVSTEVEGVEDQQFVTLISGTFFNKQGEEVARLDSANSEENISENLKRIYGFSSDEFGFVQGLEEEEQNYATYFLAARGLIHELLSGEIRNQDVELDGKFILDSTLKDCKLHVNTGKFILFGQCDFENCEFNFAGAAENVRQLVYALSGETQD